MNKSKNQKQYLFFTSEGFPEGNAASVYINNFLKGLVSNNYCVDVYLFNTAGKTGKTKYGIKYTPFIKYKTDSKLIKFILLPLVFLKIMLTFYRYKKHFKRIKVFLYNHISIYNFPVIFFANFLKIPVIAFVSEYYEKPNKKEGIFKLLKWYDFLFNLKHLNLKCSILIVPSLYLKKFYINNGFLKNRIYIQPNLTDFEYWALNNMEVKYDLGYSGTATSKDGLIHLFDGLKELKDRNIIKTALIVGDLPYGNSVLPGLKQYCKKLGILNQVTFTGLVPHEKVRHYLNQCEVLVLTRVFSRKTQAGFPTKLGEYFACKKLIISSNFGDIEQYFSNKKDLILISNLDAPTIANSVIWLKNNPSEAKEIQNSGFEKAFGVFDYKSNVNKMLKFIENCDN